MVKFKKGFMGLPVLKKSVQSTILFAVAICVSTCILTFHKNLDLNSLVGYAGITTICYLTLFLFIRQFRRTIFSVTYKIGFILSMIVFFLLITRIVSDLPHKEELFIIPFAIIPMVIRVFYDPRMGLFVLLVSLMLASFLIDESFIFIITNFITGMMAIFTLDNIFRRVRIVLTSIVIIVCYCVVYTCMSLIYGINEDIFLYADYTLFAINGALTLLCFPLIAIFEKYFMMLSDATLLNLSDTNQSLLRKLAHEAPGSFHHSLQVAALAEEAARAIGANVLLVRVGALYHDIGKIATPSFFTENQVDNVNPHDHITARESAKIIIGHVKKGVTLAKNYKLPTQIIDFISTHHGSSLVYYFYKKALDESNGAEVSRYDFSYHGPKPFSKETAVVMMADAIEASSRSLTSYTEDDINNHVEKILYIQEQDGQFSDVPLTYKDMSDIQKVFKSALLNMYHTRVAYPEREEINNN